MIDSSDEETSVRKLVHEKRTGGGPEKKKIPVAESDSDSSDDVPVWQLAQQNSRTIDTSGGKPSSFASQRKPIQQPIQKPPKQAAKGVRISAELDKKINVAARPKPASKLAKKKTSGKKATVARAAENDEDSEDEPVSKLARKQTSAKVPKAVREEAESDEADSEDEPVSKLAQTKTTAKVSKAVREEAESDEADSEDEPVSKLAQTKTTAKVSKAVREEALSDVADSEDEPVSKLAQTKTTAKVSKAVREEAESDEADSEDEPVSKLAQTKTSAKVSKAVREEALSDEADSEDEPVSKLAQTKTTAKVSTAVREEALSDEADSEDEPVSKLAQTKTTAKVSTAVREEALSDEADSEDEPVSKLAQTKTSAKVSKAVREEAESDEADSEDEPVSKLAQKKTTAKVSKAVREEALSDEADSEDEPVSKLAQDKISAKEPMAAREEALSDEADSEDEPVSKLAQKKTSGKEANVVREGADSDEAESEDDVSSGGGESDGSDVSEYVPAAKSARLGKRKVRGKTKKNDRSDSDAISSDDSYSSTTKRKRSKKISNNSAKMQKHSALSESEDDTAIDWKQAAKLKGKFSNSPRKHVEPARLASGSFLVVGRIGCRQSWKLPYRDHAGRVNLQLLEAARRVVLTGFTSRKKAVDYVIPEEAKAKLARLWTDAKLWHRAYGKSEEAPLPQKEEADEMETLDELLKRHGPEVTVGVDSDDEEDAKSDGGENSKGEDEDGEGEDGEENEEEKVDDDELAYLKEVQADQQQRQVKERFWRRDADFLVEDDDEGEEGEEGEGYEGASRLEAELRLDDAQRYSILHSESQRLLRKQHSVLPCRKEKSVELSSLMRKISARQASKCAPVEEEREEVPSVLCAECEGVVGEDCVPLVEAGGGILCSQLCLAMRRGRKPREVISIPCDNSDDESLLVVLAPPSAEDKKLRLAREIARPSRDGGLVTLEREKLRRKLQGSATNLKRETARTTGRYECVDLELETSQFEVEAQLEVEEGAPEEEEHEAAERGATPAHEVASCKEVESSSVEEETPTEQADTAEGITRPAFDKLFGTTFASRRPAARAQNANGFARQGVGEAVEEEEREANAGEAEEEEAEERVSGEAREFERVGSVEVEKAEEEKGCSFVDGEAGESDALADAQEEGEEEEVLDEEARAKAARKAAKKAARKAKREAAAARKAEKRAARQLEGEDDDLESLDDFIADSDEEEEKLVVEEEEEEEEDIIAQTIRNKLGSDWVIGDKSCPALSDGEGDEADRATAMREKLKSTLKRSRTNENAPQASVPSLFPSWDEKSLSMWSLLAENSSGPAQVKRHASARRSGPPQPTRIGSFSARRADNSSLLQQLSHKGGGSFSKTFVFGQIGGEGSSHGSEKETSSLGAAPPKARRAQSDVSGRVRSPLEGATMKPKASFLATVLSKSKHFSSTSIAGKVS